MRILVVEDEPRMLQLLRQGLQERDCAVLTAADGDTALEIATTYEFDVILLDIGIARPRRATRYGKLREQSAKYPRLDADCRSRQRRRYHSRSGPGCGRLRGFKPVSFPSLWRGFTHSTRPRREACDETSQRIQAGGLALDLARRSAFVRDSRASIDLTRSESSLLLSLVRSARTDGYRCQRRGDGVGRKNRA